MESRVLSCSRGAMLSLDLPALRPHSLIVHHPPRPPIHTGIQAECSTEVALALGFAPNLSSGVTEASASMDGTSDVGGWLGARISLLSKVPKQLGAEASEVSGLLCHHTISGIRVSEPEPKVSPGMDFFLAEHGLLS